MQCFATLLVLGQLGTIVCGESEEANTEDTSSNSSFLTWPGGAAGAWMVMYFLIVGAIYCTSVALGCFTIFYRLIRRDQPLEGVQAKFLKRHEFAK